MVVPPTQAHLLTSDTEQILRRIPSDGRKRDDGVRNILALGSAELNGEQQSRHRYLRVTDVVMA